MYKNVFKNLKFVLALNEYKTIHFTGIYMEMVLPEYWYSKENCFLTLMDKLSWS
jgi:hypothetical protein